MKSSKQIILTGLILLSAMASNANVQSECPTLAGQYEDGDDVMTITEKRNGSLYQVTLGEGAFEMTVDGKAHPIPDSPASYQASCTQGTLIVKISSGSQVGMMKYFFTSPQVLTEENSGMENYTRNWNKK